MEGLLKVIVIFLFLYAVGSLSKKREKGIERAFKRLANLFKGTPENNYSPANEKNEDKTGKISGAQTSWQVKFKDQPKVLEFLNFHGISQREWEIIQLICTGKSNKEIEDELYISLATVKDHIHNIYSKTGVKNRVQLTNMVNNSVNKPGPS